ncbi:MAG: hypothetical protein OXF19_03845 [Hyphomicrobiales bacterium]|nr:hypothetical protein [Hyphomicrobiales bacterium]
MIVSAWNGHNNNAGYGIRVSCADRDKYFSKEWKCIQIKVADGSEITCKLAASFWNTCREIRSNALQGWFIELGHTRKTQGGWERTWEKGKPPKFHLRQISGNRFTLNTK